MASNVNDMYCIDTVFSFVIFLRLVGTIYENRAHTLIRGSK